MSLQSIDIVNKNDWLICVKGPKVIISSPFDDKKEIVEDHTIEGALARVLAIDPPIMLIRLYSRPGSSKSLRLAIKWGVAEWSKANRTYVRAYLKKDKKLKATSQGNVIPFLVEDSKKL